MPTYTTHSIISKDGTRIGYRKLGRGPGLILVHGAMQSSQNFMELGKALADSFTVYIPDRRGRGMSGPHGVNFSISKEVEDIGALVEETGARNIFGLSSGAIIALQTALKVPQLQKIALYEPPLPIVVNGESPSSWIEGYEIAMEQHKPITAMVRVMKGTSDPSLLQRLPSFVLAGIVRLGLLIDAKVKAPNRVAMIDLIPTVHYDGQLAQDSGDLWNACKELNSSVLLLGGQNSRGFLTAALDKLCTIMPKAERRELPTIGHLAADNNGKPKLVASALKSFFVSSHK